MKMKVVEIKLIFRTSRQPDGLSGTIYPLWFGACETINIFVSTLQPLYTQFQNYATRFKQDTGSFHIIGHAPFVIKERQLYFPYQIVLDKFLLTSENTTLYTIKERTL